MATTEEMIDQIERNLDARDARRAARANGGRPALRLVADDERAIVLELSDMEQIKRNLASIDASLARNRAMLDGLPLLRLVD